MARSLDVASADGAGEGTIRTISDAGRARVPAPRFDGGTVIYVSVAVLTLLASCGGEAAEVPPQTSRPGPSDHALEAARTAMTTADPAPIVATFTDDFQLHSPALISPDYRGRPLVGSIVAAALQALEDVSVTRWADGTTGGLVFDARVRGCPPRGSSSCAHRATRCTRSLSFSGPYPPCVPSWSAWVSSAPSRPSTPDRSHPHEDSCWRETPRAG